MAITIKQHPFTFESWYFDCIDEATNDVFIGYTVKFTWKFINLRYHGYVLNKRDSHSERNSLTKPARVNVVTPIISMSSKLFDLSGTWEEKAPSFTETIYENEKGSVYLECFQPRSDVNIRIKNGIIAGTGYCKRIKLNIKPWQLPYKEIKWGRCHTESDTYIWVYAKGDPSINLLLKNNKQHKITSITPTMVTTEEFSLSFDKLKIVQNSRIENMITKSIPLKTLLPKKGKKIHTLKFYSPVTIRNGDSVKKGKAIFETLTF
ncbi:MAG: hypothetical protein HUU43_04595 [Ignavibacteriaceae bacterium]|nr:hypothetical protein [Ignavibacteriaceae bacterium]NUM70103.1 hypothetical protein [Ignavibacteriaceae bacterium]